MLFDSHAHLNFNAFKDNWKEVIDNCQNNDIWMINIGSQYETSTKAVSIATQYEKGVYAAIGIHPVHAHKYEFEKEKFESMVRSSNKVVAIGECGIDFFHDDNHFEKQKEQFIQQINFAKEHNLALVIHGRNNKDNTINCYEAIYKIISKEKVSRAVVHCFGGNADDAKQFLDIGINIGFTGIVTFKNAPELHQIAKDVVPIEQLLIETDCPYLAPEPYRGKENKPQYVEYVAQKIAELKNLTVKEISEKTFQNAKTLYGI